MIDEWSEIDELGFPPVKNDLLVRAAPALLQPHAGSITIKTHRALIRRVMIKLSRLGFAASGEERAGEVERVIDTLGGHRELETVVEEGGVFYRVYYSADFVARCLVVLEAVFRMPESDPYEPWEVIFRPAPTHPRGAREGLRDILAFFEAQPCSDRGRTARNRHRLVVACSVVATLTVLSLAGVSWVDQVDQAATTSLAARPVAAKPVLKAGVRLPGLSQSAQPDKAQLIWNSAFGLARPFDAAATPSSALFLRIPDLGAWREPFPAVVALAFEDSINAPVATQHRRDARRAARRAFVTEGAAPADGAVRMEEVVPTEHPGLSVVAGVESTTQQIDWLVRKYNVPPGTVTNASGLTYRWDGAPYAWKPTAPSLNIAAINRAQDLGAAPESHISLTDWPAPSPD